MAETKTKAELDREFDEAVTESAITRGHKVVMTFDGGYWRLKLVCPESGCKPPTVCGFCSADLTDPDAERCTDCKDWEPGECWLKDWFDDAPEEYIQGSVEFPVEAEWDTDHPIIHILASPSSSSSEEVNH